ncbi:flagellar hook protein FlgE [Tepidimonas aquatica]|uniref:Flagellar hook protein FlgE n=1 Tax=Tepidimonas aquatica TaxID=247482 RepID=A0A554WP88_9BURK|nr:flagellar hook protein FlgE [Tepidimonas aquatica]TSE25375.1 Flagellar hook protein FlgE [Tepidimonas aquatica]
MSFGTGLSGLNAASKNLDVIGHNIANANTTGMKAGRAEFAEMYAASLGAAGGSNGGIGVSVATVAQMFTQGNIKVTGNNMDMAINGEGFFSVQMADGSLAYTRNGEFKLDRDGNIITNNGAKLLGYQTDTAGKPTSVEPVPLNLPTGKNIDPKTSTELKLTMNLDSRADVQTVGTPLTAANKEFGTSLNVYDTLGNAIPVQLYFVKTAANAWDVVSVYQPTDPPNTPATETNLGTISFDPATGKPTLPLTLSNIQIAAGAVNATAGLPAANIDVALNFGDPTNPAAATVTQFGAKFAVYEVAQDGYPSGELTSINVGEDGVITARYSNGVSQANGQIMLTRFRNVQGLQPVNGGYWQKTQASGDPIIGQPLTGRFGLIRSGALEESNVDLTQELVNMIVAQRHYQANAQTIKTQDQVQQTLVNLR